MGDALTHAKEERNNVGYFKMESLRKFETVDIKKLTNSGINEALSVAGVDKDIIKEIGYRLKNNHFVNIGNYPKETMAEVKEILYDMPYRDFVKFRDEGVFTLEGFEYPYDLVRYCLSVVSPDIEMSKAFTDNLIHSFKVMKKSNVPSYQYYYFIPLLFPGDYSLRLVENVNWLRKENTDKINEALETIFINEDATPIECLRNYCKKYINEKLNG